MNLHRSAMAGFSALVVVLGAAACGASNGVAGSTNQAKVAEAEAHLKEMMAPPEGIGYDAPIKAQLPKDVDVAILENSTDINQRQNDDYVAAATALGWSAKRVPVGNGPEDPAKAMDQALDGKPDIIFWSGYSGQQLSSQLERAKQMGVKAVATAITDPAEGALVGVQVDSKARDDAAKAAASYIAANGSGDDHVQLYTSSTFPSEVSYGESFQKWLSELCPGCKVTANDFQISDVGSNLPSQAVSAVQRDPKTKYLVFGFGDATTGVAPALESAGLADQVTFGGGFPGPEQYKRLREGKGDFWLQDNPPWLGWRGVDIALRSITGEDTSVVTSAKVPSQLLTKDNINDALFDSEGYWIGYAGSETDYRKQWGLQ